MKKMFGIFCIAMVLVCNFTCVTVSAATIHEKIELPVVIHSAMSSNVNVSAYGGGNEYSGVVWGSLAEAQAHYGMDYVYKACYYRYCGVTYNYYYSFSDNTRCYFRVR